ncbi:tyrosine-type recombinase/integrase [Botrimarina mediterranea]|uniref:Site-specific tyrosine recombinase XerC n=1 Tax=Botrimarina mediterranea TaxID=2528022 RepID=A0A518K7N4_9BACT|nr:site-specific integrase [Botrimarina mediterranea]QDV73800.1 site-specific tyrosine recombinase XerC [Botrimarina mediterranea]
MPNLVNRPPKYRFHKSTGQAVVSIDGKAIQLGPFNSSRSFERYEELIKDWRRRRDDQRPDLAELDPYSVVTVKQLRARLREGHAVTLNELALVYEEHAHSYYRKNGKITREGEQVSEILRFLLRHYGDEDAAEFGPVKLKDFRELMIDPKGWSRKHINENVNRIRRLFAWACENELVLPAVHQALQAVAGLKKGRSNARETKRVTVIDDATVTATLQHAPEIIADMVRFQRLTGTRPGEVCNLRPCDIDRTGEIWVYEPDEHKMEHYGTQRLVMIGPKSQAVLRPYLERADKTFCFVPAETAWMAKRRRGAEGAAESFETILARAHFVARKRGATKPYDAGSYRLAVNRAALKAGVEKWSPNRLRHTAATEVRKQFGLEAAQVVCGHQSADITQVYAERDLALAIKVAQSLG